MLQRFVGNFSTLDLPTVAFYEPTLFLVLDLVDEGLVLSSRRSREDN